MNQEKPERVLANGPKQNVEREKQEPDPTFRKRHLIRLSAWLTVLVLIMAVTVYTGLQVFNSPSRPTAGQTGRALVKSEFELVDHRGNRVTEQDFKGRWQLVFFGYTFCPDICPTTLTTMAEVLDALGDDVDQVAPLFITVDPERDTKEVVAAYVAAFHPKLIGLTGTPEQVKAAAKSFRVYYAKAEKADSPDGYLIAHSGYIYLMTPAGEYEAVFTENRNPSEELAAEIKKRLGSS